MPIAQPQRMMTAGVRQVAERETEPTSPAWVDMVFPHASLAVALGWLTASCDLMHLHEEPNSKVQVKSDCVPRGALDGALRFGEAAFDETAHVFTRMCTARAGRARGLVLASIYSF
jgi:hypothetical protein